MMFFRLLRGLCKVSFEVTIKMNVRALSRAFIDLSMNKFMVQFEGILRSNLYKFLVDIKVNFND